MGKFDKYGIALSDPDTDSDADDYTDAGGISLVAGAGRRKRHGGKRGSPVIGTVCAVATVRVRGDYGAGMRGCGRDVVYRV